MLSVAHITSYKKSTKQRNPQQNKTSQAPHLNNLNKTPEASSSNTHNKTYQTPSSSTHNNTTHTSTTTKGAAVTASVPPPNLKEYADNLANAIKKNKNNNISSTTDVQMVLLEKLLYLYKPSLRETQQLSMPIQYHSLSAENVEIEPEEFIFLVHQIWYSISDAVENKDVIRNKLPEQPPAPPEVMAPQPPVSALTTQRKVSTSTHLTLLQKLSTDSPRTTSEMPRKHPVKTVNDPTSEIKKKLREIFDRAGEPRAGRYKGNFARAYNNAAKKINQSGLPNLNNRDILTNIFANISSSPVYESEKVEKFRVILSNIINFQLHDENGVIPLTDFKKIRLINILYKVCCIMGLGREHDKDKSALLEKTKKFIKDVEAAFKVENESRLRGLLQTIIHNFNSIETTFVEPINILANIHSEMLLIPPALLNESITEPFINPTHTATFIQNKKSLPDNDSPYEKLTQIDLKRIDDNYSAGGIKYFELKDELKNISTSLETLSKNLLSFLPQKIVSLKQIIFNNKNEAKKLTLLLSDMKDTLHLQEKSLSESADKILALAGETNVKRDLAKGKLSHVSEFELRLEENIMRNYNKKYTYTKLTRKILMLNESDNRPIEIKLARRWWDGVWFLGVERFCNWVSGTTAQERANDALAAVRIINTFNKDNKESLNSQWIGDDKIAWLLTDQSEADQAFKTGKDNCAAYNEKVKDFNDAKVAENTTTAENTIQINKIKDEITKLTTSINDLKLEKTSLQRRLNELNTHIPQDDQTLNSIKEWLLKNAVLIAEKIALLKDEETAEKLRNLHTKITDLLKEIDKPLEKSVEVVVNIPNSTLSLAGR